MKEDEGDIYMQHALQLARQAAQQKEIPIGAVVVLNGKIIGEGFNRNRSDNNPTRHAEIIAIEQACLHQKNERLTGCDLYVTKEPCTMCAGAIIHARIARVIFASGDSKYGACGTVFNICGNIQYNHVPEIVQGVLEGESTAMLKNFFKELRNEKN